MIQTKVEERLTPEEQQEFSELSVENYLTRLFSKTFPEIEVSRLILRFCAERALDLCSRDAANSVFVSRRWFDETNTFLEAQIRGLKEEFENQTSVSNGDSAFITKKVN